MALERLGGEHGPDVVLVPGLQGSPGIFQPLVQCLQGEFRLWGFQCSEGGLEQDRELLRSMLEQRGILSPRLVCGSYGGHVALALDHPVHSLVLTGSFPSWKAVSLKQRGMLCLAMTSYRYIDLRLSRCVSIFCLNRMTRCIILKRSLSFYCYSSFLLLNQQ